MIQIMKYIIYLKGPMHLGPIIILRPKCNNTQPRQTSFKN